MRCSVLSSAVVVEQPVFDSCVCLCKNNVGVESKQLPELFPDGLHVALDFTLVLWTGNAARINEASVMLCQLGVCPVKFRIVQIRFYNARFKVVDGDGFGNSAKPIKHVNMRIDKALLVLAKNEFYVLMAAK